MTDHKKNQPSPTHGHNKAASGQQAGQHKGEKGGMHKEGQTGHHTGRSDQGEEGKKHPKHEHEPEVSNPDEEMSREEEEEDPERKTGIDDDPEETKKKAPH